MLTYDFSNTTEKPLYELLYNYIKKDIISGKLIPNEKLPSKRSFAKNLGISTITVETAYAQLIAEGYLFSIEKKGYFVENISTGSIFAQSKNIHTNSSVSKEDNPSLKEIIDFSSNQTPHENFPFATWTKIMRKVISSLKSELMTNSPSAGVQRLRDAISTHLNQFYGINILPSQIVVGAGTEYLYGLLFQLFGKDIIYASENPGYKKISYIYKSFGAKCIPIQLDENGISIKELKAKKVDIVHISPSHQFPTGITMPITRRFELLEWANNGDHRFIIEDDYDSEFRLSGKPIPTLQSIDTTGKVIYINTFSKSLASTIRISYMILPIELAEKYNQSLGFYSCTVPNFEQYTVALFLEDGYFEKHINRMRTFYKNQRNILLKIIGSSSFSKSIEIIGENAGLHFLVKIYSNFSDTDIIRKALENGIRLTSLSQYYYSETIPKSESNQHILVLNYSSFSEKTIESGSRQLCSFFEQITKTAI